MSFRRRNSAFHTYPSDEFWKVERVRVSCELYISKASRATRNSVYRESTDFETIRPACCRAAIDWNIFAALSGGKVGSYEPSVTRENRLISSLVRLPAREYGVNTRFYLPQRRTDEHKRGKVEDALYRFDTGIREEIAARSIACQQITAIPSPFELVAEPWMYIV